MAKQAIVASVATKTGLSQKKSAEVYDAVIEAFGQELISNLRLVIPGFGTFEVRQRQARTGYAPGTREPYQIPAKRVVGFHQGRNLRDALNPELHSRT